MSRPSTSDDLTLHVTQQLRGLVAGDPSPASLAQALRLLAKWRAAVLERNAARHGPPVLGGGPFKGMAYPVRASEGARLPRMFGSYEAGLAPVIEQIIARAYPLVIDIGAAEGYYAVGLARRMPQARIMARDGDARALRLCADLAAANGVADRVEIGGIMAYGDFAICAAQPTVIICDIEGAEADLLDPALAPGLLQADLLVEVHEGMRPGTLELLTRRFAASHTITRIDRRLDDSALPPWAEGLNDLDRLLLLWEWRSSPTPWLWMTRP